MNGKAHCQRIFNIARHVAPTGYHIDFILALGVALLVLSGRSAVFAQQTAVQTNEESEETLAEKANDATATLTQLQMKDDFTPAEYGTNAYLNTATFRAILAVGRHWPINLEQLVRPTFNLVTIPQGKAASTRTEFGDTQLLDLLVSPWPDARESRFGWAVGPYFVFPTASSRSAGAGAWQAGPAAGFRLGPINHLEISGLMQQATSFAYTSPERTPITSITFQPLISYQLGHGWYVKSSDATWTFNLRHNTSTEIPLSAGMGKVWKFENGPSINASVAGEWMAYRQFANQTEQFTLKFQLTALFPKTGL